MNSTILLESPVPAIKIINLAQLFKLVKSHKITRFLKKAVKNNFVFMLLSAPVA